MQASLRQLRWMTHPSMRPSSVFAVIVLLVAFAIAERPSKTGGGARTSLSLATDGHFQVAADDLAAPEPAFEESNNASGKGGKAVTRKIQALIPAEPVMLSEKDRDPRVKHVKEGGWYQGKPSNPETARATAASSFVNRTSDWMKLSQMAAGSLASTRVKAVTAGTGVDARSGDRRRKDPAPTMPPERFKDQPKDWKGTKGKRAWDTFQGAYAKLAPFRGGTGNVIATGAAMILGPDSCILKILYSFYSMDGEDDYPYIPRGCGDMFDFALNANGLPVPWFLIVGALFIVTGTHSATNSAH